MNIMLKRPGQNSPQNLLDKFGVIELFHFGRFCRDKLQWEEPMYLGDHHPGVLFDAMKAMLR